MFRKGGVTFGEKFCFQSTWLKRQWILPPGLLFVFSDDTCCCICDSWWNKNKGWYLLRIQWFFSMSSYTQANKLCTFINILWLELNNSKIIILNSCIAFFIPWPQCALKSKGSIIIPLCIHGQIERWSDFPKYTVWVSGRYRSDLALCYTDDNLEKVCCDRFSSHLHWCKSEVTPWMSMELYIYKTSESEMRVRPSMFSQGLETEPCCVSEM